MSGPPNPSGRTLEKKSRWPSMDRLGAKSAPGPLMTGPRMTGACQAHAGSSAAVQVRRATQMSSEPARFDEKYRLSSSGESVAFCSPAAELTTGPRFTGSDHSELAKDMAWSLGAAGSVVGSHASSMRETSDPRIAADALFMRP